jgi:pimeloyl-ACP methyl ester carboxylesterase
LREDRRCGDAVHRPPTAPAATTTWSAEGFRVACEAVAAAIGARIVVFEQSAHNPQLQEPERLNALLRGVWAEAEAEALAQSG